MLYCQWYGRNLNGLGLKLMEKKLVKLLETINSILLQKWPRCVFCVKGWWWSFHKLACYVNEKTGLDAIKVFFFDGNKNRN